MKDKEKQIEEKDKMYILNTILQEVKPLKLREKIYWRIVEFVNKKLPENSVVLTREEYDNLKLEIQKAHNKGVSVGFDLTKFKENSIEQARKETAREILSEYGYLLSKRAKDEITQKYNIGDEK